MGQTGAVGSLTGDPAMGGGAQGREAAGAVRYLPHTKVSLFLTQLCNAFVRLKSQPTTQDIEKIYLRLRDLLPQLQRQTGAASPFEARIFQDLVVAARKLTYR